jgi:hypothetical protein
MLSNEDIVAATKALVQATKATASDLAVGDVAGEEDFSGQLIGRCKQKLEDLHTPNARWQVAASITEADDGPARPSIRLSVRQTKSKGPGSEESWSGADLLMVLEITCSDYEVRKGILIQAKRLEPGKQLTARDALNLRSQCKDMLDLTPSSFVFIYSKTGVTTLSASVIEGSEHKDLYGLEQWQDSTRIFFLDFIKCWIGDPRLSATDRETLAVLRAQSNARNALLLKVNEGR